MKTQIIPALDLINGEVVRLFKGDYTQKKSYDKDPLHQFKIYEKEGAKWLHLVDLSGAKDTAQRQIPIINKIAKEIQINLQVGGGIRSKDEVKALLDSGVKRVVIGSLAIKNPKLCKEFFKEFGSEALCLALDVVPKANDYIVAINAWQEQSDKNILEVLEIYKEHGLKHLLCTDISKDGTMNGANIKLYEFINKKYPKIEIQASGGVASLEDVKKLKGICSGVIVGKALLEGVFSVSEAVECLLS
ncbi:1-(5-phosphoribosyl)-5-[(5-phosphoribosylamino)methylideneamino]imidazole-4-carboxamide isomerase [Campylobacter sp. MIT 21-1685]|uniref:1-(5-phosphoribosyl)-5-[(5- phosphoribosylamino)methylideneamino]imidazole-4- carboxamide isomerase n=1 Tax=unclassified Campylobacter TaxID=2593542 RepID=UPI00224B59D5|nr:MULTISPECIES: 1-(5-phosphoribosyl)-5-[(5-phosphoribosylamino)methylideneamino]imidazole-4-carboxamide isomerase [unclassified Campylobacter]MCX2683541.1 1-(5-phosphoribosyl)-5-[(5-phosphoribosylamino)methylideneamino]imidazole-4-carboxamide isomerase [Campylobacter sp. MIT 21-1684]MCX2751798.1 1-(5-phosphoribosyl)-5-[(5-phosphoribosylamino)methylideneamino]imidazole-4-carboxamide isomerase [Campylobacter sp. MIT 21-1682]MCX2808025.1 1-(5-phosphoribosyl)-5-[(5-phosphoribosylamino)methylideneam